MSLNVMKKGFHADFGIPSLQRDLIPRSNFVDNDGQVCRKKGKKRERRGEGNKAGR